MVFNKDNSAFKSCLAWPPHRLCSKNFLIIWLPLPRTELSHSHSGDEYAEHDVAIHNGNANLDLRYLTIEVPRHAALAQQIHTVHLRFDAASVVVSGPVPPDGTTEVL